MYCIKNNDELRTMAVKNLENGTHDVNHYIKEIDKLVKEFLKDKKRYERWQTYTKIQNPKKNHEYYFNHVLNTEKSENSLYLSLMRTCFEQAQNIGLGIQDYITKNMNEKEISKIRKKVTNRLSKMYI